MFTMGSTQVLNNKSLPPKSCCKAAPQALLSQSQPRLGEDTSARPQGGRPMIRAIRAVSLSLYLLERFCLPAEPLPVSLSRLKGSG